MVKLTGGSGNDSLTGTGSSDSLYGVGGDDTLVGGAGNDRLYGGDGNDLLAGGTGSDSLDGGAGIDTVDYSNSASAVNVTLSSTSNSGGEAAGDTITGVENLVGSAFNDTLHGDAAANWIYGGAGNDYIATGAGQDTLTGGAGADTLYGGAQMDYVDYSASGAAVSIDLSNWTALYGDAQGDVLQGVDGVYGSAFNDTIIGFNQQGLTGDVYTNVLYGNAGNDYIDALGGDDIAYGGADNDTVLGNAGNDSLYGDAGNDSLSGGAGNDSLDGGIGNDTLDGGTGADMLLGGDGLDSLLGGDGADSLYGGAGTDYLSGGAGADFLQGGAGSDTINAGVGDTIDGGLGDNDILDLTGSGPYRIVYDPTNPQAGTIFFLDASGAVIGTTTFTNIERIVACFTPGTLIATAGGQRPIETLRVGDLVRTRDHGLQPIRWIGQRSLRTAELRADPSLQPILIAKGALGHGLPLRDMRVSRQHRMLQDGPRAALLFGEEEVLVRALHLAHLPGIRAEVVDEITYVHILFDRHELVLADGAWSESFQPGDRTVSGLDEPERDELFRIFPVLAGGRFTGFDAARTTLKRHEARVLRPA